MATETATIRVPRETRDRLAAQARARGLSLSAHLTRLVDDARLEAMYRSEREASRLDAENEAWQAELREWDSTVEDGLD